MKTRNRCSRARGFTATVGQWSKSTQREMEKKVTKKERGERRSDTNEGLGGEVRSDISRSPVALYPHLRVKV